MEDPERKPLKIVHFNDCYSVVERKGDICGGCPRFVALVKSFQQPRLTLFSGDLWSPSKETNIFKGEQLIDPINACEVDCACLGNHDFDLGIDRLQYLNSKCKFPWLLSNLTNINGERFASSLEYHIIEKEGYKVGLIGLIEYDWITTLSCIDVEDLIYEDFIAAGNRLAALLREEFGCDVVIALTHMRLPNDRRFAQLSQGIDLVLGGHDHCYAIEDYKNCLLIKSGTDFLCLSEITLTPLKQGEPIAIENRQFEPLNDENVEPNKKYQYLLPNFKVEVVKRDVVTSIEPDKEMEAHVTGIHSQMAQKMKCPLFVSNTPLDTKFATVRTKEAGIGNLIADLIRKEVCADCSLYNGGAIRADAVMDHKIYTIGDIDAIHPYQIKVFLVELTSEQILGVLENSVSKLPALEGRFCQVSHIKFHYDITKPPGQRIDPSTLYIDGDPYDPTKTFKVAINEYLAMGKDGFDVFKQAPMHTDPDNCKTTNEILMGFFTMFNKCEYLDEFRIYQQNETELTDNFIKLKINKKVQIAEQMATQAKIWEDEDDLILKRTFSASPVLQSVARKMQDTNFDDMDQPSLKRTISKRDAHQANFPVVKVLNRFNIALVLKKQALMSLECLIRLRKYQLIKGTEKGPNKEILPLICPKVENRIVEVSTLGASS